MLYIPKKLTTGPTGPAGCTPGRKTSVTGETTVLLCAHITAAVSECITDTTVLIVIVVRLQLTLENEPLSTQNKLKAGPF